MNTLRKFITYYSPYKTVFFIDLLCAAFISIVDLAYPQILRVLTNTLFTKDSSLILMRSHSLQPDFFSCILYKVFANIM